MPDIKRTISAPKALLQLRDLAEEMIQLSGVLTGELRQVLEQKADEIKVNRSDLEGILKELSPVTSPSSTIMNVKDGTQLMLIPEGEFLAGGLGKDEGGGEPFPVRLPAYYLAMYPVTNIQYAQFLNQAQPCNSDLELWIDLDSECFIRKTGSGYVAYRQRNDHPVVQVSWFGANAYAIWASLRLPSELEWEKGARGVDGRQYPWGNVWKESKCRNRNNRGSEKTCRVQNYPAGCSPWGLYQMSGNIWEWCQDWYDLHAYYRYRKGKLSPSPEGDYRVLRGASWYENNTEEEFRGAYRGCDEPGDRYSIRGFRLAGAAAF